ncbi:MAG: DUF4143 domain-containing protein [Coriobacteriia bacterium]|nr:DUF4143 domain-containing protein [Coriobacteriia bacterium]
MSGSDKSLIPAGYLSRIIETRVQEGLEDFGAVCIQGPKYCGKTWTGLSLAQSVFSLMLPDGSDENITAALVTPDLALNGDNPRLIDEWQELPFLWDAVRLRIDMSGKTDTFILTGSSSPRMDRKKPKHSGVGRIEKIRMRPMSLMESGESTGAISLRNLFEGAKPSVNAPETDLELLSQLIIRGGWPGTLSVAPTRSGRLARNYVQALTESGTEEDKGNKRDPQKFERLLHSLARNVEQPAASKTLIRDMTAKDDENPLSPTTIDEYLYHLKQLFILEEVRPWSPRLRSSLRINKKPKYHFVDPSIPSAILSVSHQKLINDLETFGFLFEALCLRDLLVYSEAMDAEIFYYRDREGYEVDVIIQRPDNSWAALEIKLGHGQTDEAAKKLLEIKHRLMNAGAEAPVFLGIVEGLGNFSYTRPDGVHVLPIRVLGP